MEKIKELVGAGGGSDVVPICYNCKGPHSVFRCLRILGLCYRADYGSWSVRADAYEGTTENYLVQLRMEMGFEQLFQNLDDHSFQTIVSYELFANCCWRCSDPTHPKWQCPVPAIDQTPEMKRLLLKMFNFIKNQR